MKTKAPTRSNNAQVPETIAAMTRELGAKDADSADGPGDEEVTGGEVFNDRVVFDDGGVINEVKLGDTEDCTYASAEVENAVKVGDTEDCKY